MKDFNHKIITNVQYSTNKTKVTLTTISPQSKKISLSPEQLIPLNKYWYLKSQSNDLPAGALILTVGEGSTIGLNEDNLKTLLTDSKEKEVTYIEPTQLAARNSPDKKKLEEINKSKRDKFYCLSDGMTSRGCKNSLPGQRYIVSLNGTDVIGSGNFSSSNISANTLAQISIPILLAKVVNLDSKGKKRIQSEQIF